MSLLHPPKRRIAQACHLHDLRDAVKKFVHGRSPFSVFGHKKSHAIPENYAANLHPGFVIKSEAAQNAAASGDTY